MSTDPLPPLPDEPMYKSCPSCGVMLLDSFPAFIKVLHKLDEVKIDRDEWKQQHENLLSVRQSDLATNAAARAELEAEVAQLKRIEQVCYDIHAALDVKWGDNPYLAISQRDERIRELETFKEQHQLACAYMDDWERVNGDAPHRVVRLADRMLIQRKAAEAEVAGLEHQLELAEHDSVSQSQLYSEYTEEWAKERDTLNAQIAELQEKLMVMCVAQIKELGAAIPAQLTDEQIKRLWWDRANGQGWDGIFSFARAIVVSALGPSPAPPAPAPLAAQGVEGEPHGREDR